MNEEDIMKDCEKVDLITLIRTFKKEGMDNFIVIRKNKFENLINRNKELGEENEELKQKLHRVCKEVNKVEWETHSMIPKSLVKEKIEEYTTLLKNCNRFSDVDRIKAINERILTCKELLEKRRKI